MPESLTPGHSLEMLTDGQVENELNISHRKLLKLLDSGKLRCFRLGAAGEEIRVLRRDVTEFLVNRELMWQRRLRRAFWWAGVVVTWWCRIVSRIGAAYWKPRQPDSWYMKEKR